MSRNTVERALYQLCVDRTAKQRFRESPEKFLERFVLDDSERQMLIGFDVAGLQRLGVNPMLTMGFWQELSPEKSMRGYMSRLRPVTEGDAVFSASLKQ